MTAISLHRPLSPLRIMLVDDHQTMLWGLQQLIDSQKPRMEVVAIASTGASALERAHLYQPDLIVLDVDLGPSSSLAILPALLAGGNAKVLLLTGMRDEATLEHAVSCGARGIVRKEEATTVLLQAIEKVHAGELWLDREMTARVFHGLREKNQHEQNETRKFFVLTPKERQVVAAVTRELGASNKAIAQKLFISEHTLRNHLSSIYHKLDLGNRIELYQYAVQHGLADKQL